MHWIDTLQVTVPACHTLPRTPHHHHHTSARDHTHLSATPFVCSLFSMHVHTCHTAFHWCLKAGNSGVFCGMRWNIFLLRVWSTWLWSLGCVCVHQKIQGKLQRLLRALWYSKNNAALLSNVHRSEHITRASAFRGAG